MNNLFRPDHLELVCPSCKKHHHAKWKPEFWKHDHYKTLKCDCGYKVFIKTEHLDSGHYGEEEMRNIRK